ncbi:MAG: hypothetical protein VW405_01035 [Rhodospirillaceae bacterium]
MSYAPSVIKSIQHVTGSASWSGGSDNKNVAISSVNTAKSMIVSMVGGRNASSDYGTWYFTSGTNVYFNLGGSGSGYPQTLYYAFTVVEFY